MKYNEKNPFMVSFSREPEEVISRPDQVEKVVNTFTMEPVTDQIFMITGIRGAGKTVFMTSIANGLESRDDWMVIRCTPTGDILGFIASELARLSVTNQFNLQIEIPLPFSGRVELSKQQAYDNNLSIIDRTLDYLLKHGKHLLVTIDEVTNTEQMKEFASAFQILIGKKYPIFFLGTGLYKNIQELKNEPNMTFLYRAPRINIGPLNMAAIARKYQMIFDISIEEAAEMSKLTLGYSYAFQALGYSYWEHKPVKDMEPVLHEYDDMLDESAYSKMWSELSAVDRKICHAIAESEDSSVKTVREAAGMTSNQFTVYRERLKKQGLLNTSEYGKVAFALPRFAEFVKTRSLFYELPE